MVRDHLPAFLDFLWHTHVALIVITDTLDVIDANDASLALSGYQHHHIVGKPLAAFLDVNPTTAAQLEHTRQSYYRKTSIDDYTWTLIRHDQRTLEVAFSRQWIVKYAGNLFQVVIMMPAAERPDVNVQLEVATDAFWRQRQQARVAQNSASDPVANNTALDNAALALEALASDNLETIIAVHRSQPQPKSRSQQPATPRTTPRTTPRVTLNVSNGISSYDNITVTLNKSDQQPLYHKQATRAYVIDLETSSAYSSTYSSKQHNDNHTQHPNEYDNVPTPSDDDLRQLVWDFR